MSLTSFLSGITLDDKRCILCNLIIANHDLIVKTTSEGFSSLREQAPKWGNINAICCSEPLHSEFRNVLDRPSTSFHENYNVLKMQDNFSNKTGEKRSD